MSLLFQSVKWDKKQVGDKFRELEEMETDLYNSYKKRVVIS